MLKETILSTKLLPEQTALFYLGQVGFLFKNQDKYILVDGYLTDYVDRHFKTELVPWERRYPAPMSPEELDFVDYVFCTHDHADHADPDTLTAIARVNSKAKFYVPAPVRENIVGLGLPEERVIGMHPDVQVALDEEMAVTAIPAAHEELHPTEEGDYPEMGYVFEIAGKKIYHSGDCCPYDGLEDRLAGCNVLIMPINGRDYYRRYVKDIIGNFDSVEVLTIADNVGADMVVPVHFDLYDVNALNPAYFVDCVQKINPMQKYHIFAVGERYVLM